MIRMNEGRELVARIVADMAAHGLEPDAREIELLSLAEGLADRLAELEEAVEVEGLSVTLLSGRVVMNPAVAESRMTRTALATVLGRVSMVEGAAKDPQRVAAAQKRWLQHNLAKARGHG
jgi:hypothetical protein